MIDQKCLSRMFLTAATLLKKESDGLSEIDSRFGDGDHGVTIAKIAQTIERKVADWSTMSLHDWLETLGDAVMEVGGGSAGPLYGTMIGGLAAPLTDQSGIDPSMLKAMLAGSRDAMLDISKARIGDKTMMDALLPAVDAALHAPDSTHAILDAAAQAASEGAQKSRNFISRFGRAKSYKEQTIGTPDAGAVSTAIFFQGLAEGAHKAGS